MGRCRILAENIMNKIFASALLVGSLASGNTYACSSLEQVNWLLGSWQQKQESRVTTETWNRVSNDTFEGLGSVSSAKGIFNETLRLVNMSGEVFYLAKTPGNALPIAFLLQECSANIAVFVNPNHDFPQKIEYRLSSSNTLEVFVSASGNKGFKLELTSVN